jgi:hypothetical protein
LKAPEEKSRVRSLRTRTRKYCGTLQIRGSGPYQNVPDPEQRFEVSILKACCMDGILIWTSCWIIVLKKEQQLHTHTANEGPVRIQNKCLVPIYVFPEMKLRGLIIFRTEL